MRDRLEDSKRLPRRSKEPYEVTDHEVLPMPFVEVETLLVDEVEVRMGVRGRDEPKEVVEWWPLNSQPIAPDPAKLS